MIDNSAVVIVSCKRFEQVWDPFFKLFKKYWPDCPFKVYFITDFGNIAESFVETIEIKQDLKFAGNLIFGLNNIKEDNILYFQEDYLFCENFKTDKILMCLDILKSNEEIGCIRLAPCPGPTAVSKYSADLGILQKGEQYRVSTQVAIWKKRILLSLLKNGESSGNFEIFGTIRSNFLDSIFLSVWRGETPTPYYMTAVTKGIWEEGALDLLRKENILTSNITKKIP